MKRPPRILVVEHEPAVAEMIVVNLRHNGFSPVCAVDGEAALREVDTTLPDAILLDWMLPGGSALKLARRWRSDPRTVGVPILMLTAKEGEPDMVARLDAGADDYMTKPFSTREMQSRLRAVLRRRVPERVEDTVTIGDLVLDGAEHRVTWAGKLLKLGPTEFKLLQYLMTFPERVHSRQQLLDRVWGHHVFIEARTVDVHVKRLREALGAAGTLLETVRGVGYRMTAHPQVPVATPASGDGDPGGHRLNHAPWPPD